MILNDLHHLIAKNFVVKGIKYGKEILNVQLGTFMEVIHCQLALILGMVCMLALL